MASRSQPLLHPYAHKYAECHCNFYAYGDGNCHTDGNTYSDSIANYCSNSDSHGNQHSDQLSNGNLHSYTHAGAHCDFHFYATANSNINSDCPPHYYAHTCADRNSHSDGDCRTDVDANIDTYFNSYSSSDIAFCAEKADFYTTSHVYSSHLLQRRFLHRPLYRCQR